MKYRDKFSASVWRAVVLNISCALAQSGAPATNINVLDVGAVPDGKTLNTIAIQKAIDVCSQEGGGIVTIPPGRFVTGTIQMKSGVTLVLADQAVLLGSTNIEDYQNLDPFQTGSDGKEKLGYALIIGMDVKNVGLAGPGMIDGRGVELKNSEGHYDRRPLLVRWVKCTGVSVHDVTLTNSGAWTMNFFQSQNVLVDKVIIRSRNLANNDGIDVDSSHSVQITDCDIDSGDDSICFKTTSPVPCRDIQVKGCTIHSNEAAIKFGTESMGDFDNITISSCHVLSARGGIKMFSVDGAHLHDIHISDIVMEKTNLAIMIRLGARLKVFRAGDNPLPIGEIDGVKIEDIVARDCSNIGLLISGIPGHRIKNIVLQNIEIHLPGNGGPGDTYPDLPEKESAYPEINMFGDKLPASGAFIRHVDNLKLSKFILLLMRSDLRSSLVCQDGENLEFTNLAFPFDNNAAAPVRLDSCHHVLVDAAQQVSQESCSDVITPSR